MISRNTIQFVAGIAALSMAANVQAQETQEPNNGPGVIVFQNGDDNPAKPDPNDPRPLILQDVNSLFVMLRMGEMPADGFREDLEKYNAAFPAPSTAEMAAALHEYESTRAQKNGTCAAKLPTKVKIASSTAAPALRHYIGQKEITNGWIVSHKPKGCGKQPARVYTVVQQMDGKLVPIRMGDGETLINLNVHYDLSRLFADNLLKFYASKNMNCEGQFISRPNMRVVSKGGDWSKPFYGTYISGKWREEWTFKGCGGTAVVPIDLEWKGATDTEFLVQFPEATFTPDS